MHNRPTRFVSIDRDLLRRRYTVTEHYEKSWCGFVISGLLRAVRSHHIVFCWFASWHSLLPVLLARLLRKPSVVVTGGYDVANLPEIGYGSQRGGLRRWVARTVIHNATVVLAFSNSACREAVQNAQAQPDKVKLLYQGVPPLGINRSVGRVNSVLTVGDVSRDNIWRKGLLPFVRAARLFPDYAFLVVGEWRDSSIEVLHAEAPPNVQFLGRVSDDQLASLYVSSKVYVQASLHEGFGMSLAEAMLGGCIPVVTKAGSLPEVVGETGVYIDSQAPEQIAKGIELALQYGEDQRRLVRQRVKGKFSLEQRGARLLAVVEALTPEYRNSLQPAEVGNEGLLHRGVTSNS